MLTTLKSFGIFALTVLLLTACGNKPVKLELPENTPDSTNASS